MPYAFSQRTRRMKVSAIREILKVASLRGVVSLAGGLPAPESFPLTSIHTIIGQILKEKGSLSLQYGLSEGLTELKAELIKEHYRLDQVKYQQDELMVANGSQEVLDLVGKIFINRGDRIAVESPTYLGALQAFEVYEPKYVAIPGDNQGIIPEALEQVLKKVKIKLIYLVPNFQNPAGITIAHARRNKIARLSRQYRVITIEDDPYRRLRFTGKDLPSIASFDHNHYILYTSTFSKILSPGLRLGWVFGNQEIIHKLVMAKQGANLHTGTFSQYIAYYYLKDGHLSRHIPKIIDIYRQKSDYMGELLTSYLGSNVHFIKPEGGMFYWVVGGRQYDFTRLYPVAAHKYRVAYVPGEYFYAPSVNKMKNTMRLNFSYSSKQQIKEGIKRLAKLFL